MTRCVPLIGVLALVWGVGCDNKDLKNEVRKKERAGGDSEELAEASVKAAYEALASYENRRAAWPVNLGLLTRGYKAVPTESIQDPWGNEMMHDFATEPGRVCSAGKDAAFGTLDDVCYPGAGKSRRTTLREFDFEPDWRGTHVDYDHATFKSVNGVNRLQ